MAAMATTEERAALAGSRLPRRVALVMPMAIAFVVFVTVWTLAIWIFTIPTYLLPSPWSLVVELVTHPLVYLRHAGVTLIESTFGFFIGALIGAVIAVILNAAAFVERSLMPYLIALSNVPIVAFAPIVVIYFGFGMESKIVTAAFLTFFPVVVYTLRGLKSADVVHRDLFHVLASSRRDEFIHLRLPASLPYLFSALKVAATASVLAATVAEFIQASQGLGWLILTSAYTNDMVRVWSTVIVCSTIAMVFYGVVALVERRMIPWHSSQSGRP